MQLFTGHTLITVALFASIVSASPTAPPKAPRPVTYNDGYDDFTVTPVLGSTVTTRNALTYNAFDFFTSNDPTVLLKAASPPNFIGTTPRSQLTAGQPSYRTANASVLYFDQKYLCYACGTYTAANAPETCTIQAAGRKTDGTTVVQELVYNPGLLSLKGGFNCTAFPGTFSKLIRMDFQVLSATTTPTLTLAALDSNKYVAYLN
ncbi:MAG: hypothetical protein M1831_003134 [Alyxoria varia]|nr:MAG: hypothetical protein M1831_003134 [Alyxoria varia]